MEQITKLILEQLDIKTLRNIEKYCEKYINYSVDYSQIIRKYNVKVQTKELADLQEYCNFLIVLKQVEQKEKANSTFDSENITSTMQNSGVESKKKENKA